MNEPADAKVSRIEAGVNHQLPYVIRVSEENAIPLLKLLTANGLSGVMGNPERYLRRIKDGRLKLPPQEIALLEHFQRANDVLKSAGRLTSDTQLTFRSVRRTKEELNKALADSFEYGGKRPDSQSSGINVEEGQKVQELVEASIMQGHSNIIYVYDKGKLVPVEGKERETDPMMEYGFGMKPKEGFELKDALLGMVVTENESTHYDINLHPLR